MSGTSSGRRPKPDGKGRQGKPQGSDNRRSNRPQQQRRREPPKDQKTEKQPFVPWLGEERPTKGPILDLETYKDREINVVFAGGREVEGVLAGFDSLMNLVLTNVVEKLDDQRTRTLGTLVARGPLIQSIAPVEGSEFIENPF